MKLQALTHKHSRWYLSEIAFAHLTCRYINRNCWYDNEDFTNIVRKVDIGTKCVSGLTNLSAMKLLLVDSLLIKEIPFKSVDVWQPKGMGFL